MKTVIGKNKFLYLKSELELQYNTTEEDKDLKGFNFYFKTLQNIKKDFFMFVVPDKSIICKDNLPEPYNKNNNYRVSDCIKLSNFIDLLNLANLESSDYYITDTHSNNKGALKLTKSIMKFFLNDDDEINKIDNFLKTKTIHNFHGDLTAPINLENQQLVKELNLNEDILEIENICYNDYINKIKDVDIKYRFCYTRPSKYVYNKNAIIKQKILIYGDSTCSNKMFELLSFYFEETFFYWNHFLVNNELIEIFNPDIFIDIRTERFLSIPYHLHQLIINNDSYYNINNTLLSYDNIYSILVNIDEYTFNHIINNINSLDEIRNNLNIFSCILCHYTNLIKPYIKLNKDDVLNLNNDLFIFYDNKTDPEISDLKLIKFINRNKTERKYKYENIPEDFNAKEYIELNDDLKHMSEIEAKTHYENYGYKEDRKYNYQMLDLNFNIYIYCSPKSGSSTLTKTFNKNGYKAFHVHSIEHYKECCIEYRKNNNLFKIIEESMLSNEKVYIIDSYRNQIERKISSFFQNYIEQNNSIDYITKKIDNYIYFSEDFHSINEVFHYFNIEKFASFDFEKKYNIKYYKNITFIKLRFEDIDEWKNILSTIFNKPITIYNDNISENKSYSKELKIIKNEYKIPNFMIDEIKNNTEFKIYNTLESQQKYLEYWTKRSKIPTYENIPEDFNATKYIELHEDLKHMTEIGAKIHYEINGYKENRKYKYENIPEDFNAKEYIELNSDLTHITEIEAKSHYEDNGYKENRKYKYKNIPYDFKAKTYIELNEDLKHITEIGSKIHYEECGYKEDRKYKYENIPDDFNPREYIELHEDLKHMSEIRAKIHYEVNGYKENRKYKYENIPDDFNPAKYIQLNKDLNHMTEIQAKSHYENCGSKENRKYKYENIMKDFN